MTQNQDEDRLSAIVEAAEKLSQSRGSLAEKVRSLRARIDELQHQARVRIGALADAASNDYAALESLISDSPHLFVKPKTRRVNGLKIGFRKKPGKIQISDEAKVIELIRSELPAQQAYMLIRQRETVDKKALADLEVEDLARLGVVFTEDEDQVVIDFGDAEIDRFLKQLIKDVGGGNDSVRAA